MKLKLTSKSKNKCSATSKLANNNKDLRLILLAINKGQE